MTRFIEIAWSLYTRNEKTVNGFILIRSLLYFFLFFESQALPRHSIYISSVFLSFDFRPLPCNFNFCHLFCPYPLIFFPSFTMAAAIQPFFSLLSQTTRTFDSINFFLKLSVQPFSRK